MENNRKKKWYHKLRNKYRLVIFHDETFEEKISFAISRINVFVALVSHSVILIVTTIYLIAFTPLREYIPGYTDVGLVKQVHYLERAADSIETVFRQQELYLSNIRRIIEGYDELADSIEVFSPEQTAQTFALDTIKLTKSVEDSLLRLEFERSRYNLYYDQIPQRAGMNADMRLSRFFVPLNGTITNRFNISSGHFGIDIVSGTNEAIKATLDGTVIFADWTLDKGHVIGVQHPNNMLSVYKHNAVLLKKEGEHVKAGEAIAIVGSTGELTTGPHLHFELWHNGVPVDPEEYILF